MNEIDYTKITDSVTQQINSSMGGVFALVAIGSVILTIVFVVFWIINSIRKIKVQKAILEIQKDIHEMNELQKGTQPSSTTDTSKE